MPFPVDRRSFLKSAAAAAAVTVSAAGAAPKKTAADAETLTATLYKSLTEQQKSEVCFGFDHPLALQSREPTGTSCRARSASFSRPDQQAMIDEIFRKLHNPDFVDKVMRHMEEDGKAWLTNYAVALFGEPGTGKFRIRLHRPPLHRALRWRFSGGRRIRRADFLWPSGRSQRRREARSSGQRLLVPGQARQRGV